MCDTLSLHDALPIFYESEFEPENWKNPIRHKVKEPKVPEALLDPVDPEVVNALCLTCKRGTFLGDRDRAILRLLLNSGMRAAELLALNIEDMNLILRKGKVKHGKGGDSREIYFNQQTRRDIRAYLKHRPDPRGPLIWSEKDQKRLAYDGLRAMIKHRAHQAGLEAAPTAHMFRRAFAKDRLKAGVDLMTVSRLLGHKSLAATRRYLKLNDDDLQEASDRGSE
jgi:site-specific recombinase XerD